MRAIGLSGSLGSGSFATMGKQNFRSSSISAHRLPYIVLPMCSMNMRTRTGETGGAV